MADTASADIAAWREVYAQARTAHDVEGMTEASEELDRLLRPNVELADCE